MTSILLNHVNPSQTQQNSIRPLDIFHSQQRTLGSGLYLSWTVFWSWSVAATLQLVEISFIQGMRRDEVVILTDFLTSCIVMQFVCVIPRIWNKATVTCNVIWDGSLLSHNKSYTQMIRYSINLNLILLTHTKPRCLVNVWRRIPTNNPKLNRIWYKTPVLLTSIHGPTIFCMTVTRFVVAVRYPPFSVMREHAFPM